MLISPMLFLTVVCAATLAVVVVHIVLRQAQARQVRKLAQEWQMHYTAGDRFRLSGRVAQRLGVPGAASVRVEDVIYGSEGENYRYYFTAQYTVGVVRRQTDQRVVCTATEKKQRDGAGELAELTMAPMELSIVEQYRRVRGSAGGSGANR